LDPMYVFTLESVTVKRTCCEARGDDLIHVGHHKSGREPGVRVVYRYVGRNTFTSRF
jgi:hypothetical protein